jgi:hypothetical protein
MPSIPPDQRSPYPITNDRARASAPAVPQTPDLPPEREGDRGDGDDPPAARRWHRKTVVARRYGVTTRTVDRKAADGSLPKPKFPLGPNLPLWDGVELDEHDARARGEAVAA